MILDIANLPAQPGPVPGPDPEAQDPAAVVPGQTLSVAVDESLCLQGLALLPRVFPDPAGTDGGERRVGTMKQEDETVKRENILNAK